MPKPSKSEHLKFLLKELYSGNTINTPIEGRKAVLDLNAQLNRSSHQIDDPAYRQLGKRLDQLYNIFNQQVNN